MSSVHLIATGGTIAMAKDPAAGGAVLSLGGSDLASALRSLALPIVPALTSEEYGPLPSCQFTVDHLWGLRQRVVECLAQTRAHDSDGIQGIVITHGTDTLEETAYLLDLTVPSSTPIVVTGAMRVASDPGYDGYANLIAAVRVAASAEAENLGTLVVLNDEIHSARDVTKTHSQSLDTFQSPSWGPIGRVEAERVVFTRRVQRQVLECPSLEPGVLLVKLAVGMDAGILRLAVSNGARGVVIEAFGGGRVPPWWLDPIRQAVSSGVAVAITSRCAAGSLGDPYRYTGAYKDLVEAGCLIANGLNGQKARIKLMAALGASCDPVTVRLLFG
jgi:L-asparaginase